MEEASNTQSYRLTEYDDYWTIPIVGERLTQIIIGLGLRFQFLESEEQTFIWIGGEFHLEVNGEKHLLSTEEPAKLEPLLALVNAAVESARAYKDGLLELNFEKRGKLSMHPHPEVESWGITGAYGLRVVCTPGGELAIWQADPPARGGPAH